MAIGDIGALIQQRDLMIENFGSAIVQVAGDVYAFVYSRGVLGNRVATVTITSAGAIAAVAIADWQYAALASAWWGGFLKIAPGVYASVYADAVNKGTLITFQINDDGTIPAVIFDTLTFEPGAAATILRGDNFLHVGGNIYALAYQIAVGANTMTRIATIDIDAAGNIGAALIATLDLLENTNHAMDLVHISGNIYAVADAGAGAVTSKVRTLTIDAAGNIGAAAISTLVLDNASIGSKPKLFQVSGTVWAVAYTAPVPGLQGRVKTFTIDAAGNIGAVIISFDFDANVIGTCGMAFGVGTTNFTIFYEAPDPTHPGRVAWWGVTLNITTAGVVTGITSQVKIRDAPGGENVVLWSGIRRAAGIFIESYQAEVTQDGWLGSVPVQEVVLPAVTTGQPTAAGIGYSNLNGALANDGGEACDCGFDYGTTPAMTTRVNMGSFNTGGVWSLTIAVARFNRYYYRAFATNLAGTAYGDVITFKPYDPVAGPLSRAGV